MHLRRAILGYAGSDGFYWSKTFVSNTMLVYYLYFDVRRTSASDNFYERYFAFSVRRELRSLEHFGRTGRGKQNTAHSDLKH